jgi:hypothetical protein
MRRFGCKNMSFQELVEEVRHLPFEELLELRSVLDAELSNLDTSFSPEAEKKILDAHREAMDEYHEGQISFTSDSEQFLRELKHNAGR